MRPTVNGERLVATPSHDREVAMSLANWIAPYVGAKAKLTGIVTYTGGYFENGSPMPGRETRFTGALLGPPLAKYKRFWGSIALDRGTPGYATDVQLDGVEFTSSNLSSLDATQQARVRDMLASFVQASGVASTSGAAQRLSPTAFSDFSAYSTMPAASADATPHVVGIDFADGLIPGDTSFNPKQ